VRTEKQILRAAAEEFAHKGFSDVRLLDIADRAGVTKGAVYFHYSNKEALAFAVAQEYYARLGALFAGVNGLGLTPLEATAELMNRTAAVLVEDTFFQAAVRLQVDFSPDENPLPTPFVGFVETLTELLTQARSTGQLPEAAGEPAALARVLVAALYGAQHISWVLHDRADVVERIREVVEVVILWRDR
jgi:AcrR family transcriptional regulator